MFRKVWDLLSFYEKFGETYLECHLMHFHQFLTKVSYFDVHICTCRYQSCFRDHQTWSALVLLMFSKSKLKSAEKRQITETALFSADYLWDFNPGTFSVFSLALIFNALCTTIDSDAFSFVCIREHIWILSKIQTTRTDHK